MRTVIESHVERDEYERLLYYPEGSDEGRKPENLDELIDAVETALDGLRTDIHNDLVDIYKQLE